MAPENRLDTYIRIYHPIGCNLLHTVLCYLSFVSLEIEFVVLNIFYLFFLNCKLFNFLQI